MVKRKKQTQRVRKPRFSGEKARFNVAYFFIIALIIGFELLVGFGVVFLLNNAGHMSDRLATGLYIIIAIGVFIELVFAIIGRNFVRGSDYAGYQG